LQHFTYCKGFVDKFSRDLAVEVKPHGILVQTVHPGFIVSKLSQLSRTNLLIPNAENYVSGHLRTLGLESRTAGFWVHKILVSLIYLKCEYLLKQNYYEQMYWAELCRLLLPGFSDWLGLLILKTVSDQIKRNKKCK
jgi:short-subunit dehydrogenase